jgi:decaprenylphospho-beta-D-erythro-pentofuranosid-2-ulose 2-reductase
VAVLQSNLVGAGSLLLHAVSRLREDGGGRVIVLSSAAAGRPRRANAVYGASKAGLDSLAQSLGDDLYDQGVRILVVRPGFVRTRMTAGLSVPPLATTPRVVAAVTVDAMDRGAPTVWAPRALQAAMLAMAIIPRRLFRRIRQ